MDSQRTKVQIFCGLDGSTTRSISDPIKDTGTLLGTGLPTGCDTVRDSMHYGFGV